MNELTRNSMILNCFDVDVDDIGDVGMETFVRLRQKRREILGQRYSSKGETKMAKQKATSNTNTGQRYPIGTPNDQPAKNPTNRFQSGGSDEHGRLVSGRKNPYKNTK